MKKVTLDEAKVVAEKVNQIIQSSYLEGTTFTIQDIINVGLDEKQAERVMRKFVQDRIVFLFEGKYAAHPKTLAKMKEEMNEQRPTL